MVKREQEVINNIDSWIKDINKRLSKLEENNKMLVTLIDNSNHNYELIDELKEQLDETLDEVEVLKMMTVLSFEKITGKTLRKKNL